MALAQRVYNLHWLHLERHGGVLAEHGAHGRQDRARLAQIGGRALYEDVARGQRHLRPPRASSVGRPGRQAPVKSTVS